MAEHNLLGDKGEELALNHLASEGYKILERKWRFIHKEVDIIAMDGEILVFAEVKTRTDNYWGNPEEFVTKKKQKFLIKSAEAYIEQINFVGDSRFDIVSVIINGNETSIELIKEAFYP